MRRLVPLVTALAALALAAPAPSSAFTTLPRVDRDLSSARATDRSCALVTGHGRTGSASGMAPPAKEQ